MYFDEKCGEYKKKRQRVTIYVYFDEKCSEYKKKKKNKTKVNIYQLVALAICFR